MMWDWVGQAGYLITLWVTVWSCLKTLETAPRSGFLRIWLQLISYYARYFMLWLGGWAVLHLSMGYWHSLNYAHPLSARWDSYWLTLVGVVLYVYMGWFEPNFLRTHYQTIQLSHPSQPLLTPVKVAVLGDVHVGLFSGKPHQLHKLVKRLNQLDVDAVLITGDWLYHAGADIIGKMTVLRAINKPCYTIFSEQDTKDDNTADLPEFRRLGLIEPSNNTLSHALSVLNILPIDDKSVAIGGVNLVGVGAVTSVAVARLLTSDKPNLILTHDIKQIEANPSYLGSAEEKKLVIAGQTHGGQVNIPFFTRKIVQASLGNPHHAGLHTRQLNRRHSYQVWTTTGIGMTGLPFRLNCPPTIDVLTIE